MLRILNKNEKPPQKKLISFQNFELIDGMIKSEAANSNTSDSFVVEKILIEHYFHSNDTIASAIASNLFKENGVVLSLRAINKIYILHPEYANNSLLNILRYALRLSQEYPVSLTINTDGVKELSYYAAKMEAAIKKVVDAEQTYQFWDADKIQLKHVDYFDLVALHDVSDAATSQRKLDMENLLYLGICSIVDFWNFGSDSDDTSLKNWKGTYLFLDSILNLCKWPDYPAIKFEFSQLVKEIALNKCDNGIYESSAPVLSKTVYINRKTFATTKDAIILHSEKGQDDGYFFNANRIIHGPGMPMTKKPYIILSRHESLDELETIVEDLVKDYPSEFPNPHDSYIVPFLNNGVYYDNRIHWKTI